MARYGITIPLPTGRGKTYQASTPQQLSQYSTEHNNLPSVQPKYTPPSVHRGPGTSALPSHSSRHTVQRQPSPPFVHRGPGTSTISSGEARTTAKPTNRRSVNLKSTPPSAHRGSESSALSSRQADHLRITTTTRDRPATSRPVQVSAATAAVLARSRAALREAEQLDIKWAHLSTSLNTDDDTAAVLARSRAALREAERLDIKWAHVAAPLNIQLPCKSEATRKAPRDRQSRGHMPDAEPRHRQHRELPGNASKPAPESQATITADVQNESSKSIDIWTDLASSYAREAKEAATKVKDPQVETDISRGASSRVSSIKSSTSRMVQNHREDLSNAQDNYGKIEARSTERAIARAQEKERELENQALQGINRPNYQTFFEHQVAPLLRSESPSSDIDPRPAVVAWRNREPRRVLPSRGWEFTPQLQGAPKREARRHAITARSSATSKPRNDMPCTYLPPRSSAPLHRTVSESSTDSSLSFRSALSGTSLGGRSECSTTTSLSTGSRQASPTPANAPRRTQTMSRNSSYSTVDPRDEAMSQISIPRQQARDKSSSLTRSTRSTIPEEKRSAIATTRERSRTSWKSSRSTSASSLPEEHMSTISIPLSHSQRVSATSESKNSSLLREQRSALTLDNRRTARTVSIGSATSLESSLFTAENMSAISVPRDLAHIVPTTSSDMQVSTVIAEKPSVNQNPSRSRKPKLPNSVANTSFLLPEEQMSAISIPRQSSRAASSSSSAGRGSMDPEEHMSTISVPQHFSRTASSNSSISTGSTLPEEVMSVISVPRHSSRTTSSSASASSRSTPSREPISAISISRHASRSASSSSSIGNTPTLPEEGISTISNPRQSSETAPSSSKAQFLEDGKPAIPVPICSTRATSSTSKASTAKSLRSCLKSARSSSSESKSKKKTVKWAKSSVFHNVELWIDPEIHTFKVNYAGPELCGPSICGPLCRYSEEVIAWGSILEPDCRCDDRSGSDSDLSGDF